MAKTRSPGNRPYSRNPASPRARGADSVRASAEVRGVCVLGCGRCGVSAFCEVKLSSVGHRSPD
eukprot:6945915-Prymnesium_polylepis.1